MKRQILHLHIPCFQISLERALEPRLRYRPVVVAAPPEGGILSCSPEAKKEGIRPGMGVVEAKRLCPKITIIRPDPFKVEKALQSLSLYAQRYSPIWELSKAGHLYLDLTGSHRLWDPKEAARSLMKEIKEDLGVTGATGIATNKLVSHIASLVVPAFDILEVGHGEEGRFMAPLDVGLLPALYPKEADTLRTDLGITRIELLWQLDFSLLKLLFGARAPIVYDQARGIDYSPVYPPNQTPKVEERIVLPTEENEDETVRSYLFVLLERCMEKIQGLSLSPKRGGFWIRYADYLYTMRSFWPQGDDIWGIFRGIEGPLKKAFTRKIGIRELGLWFRCVPKGPAKRSIQEFFKGPSPNPTIQLQKAIRQIRERFGRDAINYGIALGARA